MIDGDTLRCGAGFKERVRISGIDAPELFSPKCRAENRRAEWGKARLEELVDGRDLLVRREGKDQFGRTLATVYAGETDVGAVLLYEGLARWWEDAGNRGADREAALRPEETLAGADAQRRPEHRKQLLGRWGLPKDCSRPDERERSLRQLGGMFGGDDHRDAACT